MLHIKCSRSLPLGERKCGREFFCGAIALVGKKLFAGKDTQKRKEKPLLEMHDGLVKMVKNVGVCLMTPSNVAIRILSCQPITRHFEPKIFVIAPPQLFLKLASHSASRTAWRFLLSRCRDF